MKVAELVAAFQRFAATQNNNGSAATNEAPPPQPVPPARTETAEKPPATEPDDRITVSPEAVFTFAASQFDPQRIARANIAALTDVLYDGGAISERDRAILESPPDGRAGRLIYEPDPSAPTNLVTEFQGRLSSDLANDDIRAVEEDTRALSILGRLVSIREELTSSDPG